MTVLLSYYNRIILPIMSLLSQKINKHLERNFTAFHSPAHAGKLNPRDLTELDGLDDLQYPEEVLKESQEFVAELFGAKKSFFLVNGASVGMQAACISLKIYLNSINDKRPVLVARNVHKSVIAGIILAGLEIEWLEPEWREDLGIYAAVIASSHASLATGSAKQSSMEGKYSALIITNPSYEGFYSEIPQLNIPLIVDEAHGAHCHFSDQLPEPALAYGADVVVQSWHKTLGSLGQTGVLHVNKASKIPENFIQDALRLLQTTSPSYLLMESITNTAELYAERGIEIVERTIELSKMIELPNRVKNDDPYRLLIKGPGHEIESLLKENNILIEAAGTNYALAFINPGNDMDDISKLNGQRSRVNGLIENYQTKSITRPEKLTANACLRDAFFSGDTEIYAPCPPGIAVRLPGQG